MALSHDHPVGREPELERLGEALDDLERGGNPCVAVEGEAGIGKTWLLSELRRRAEERGHLVLAGAAAEFERDLPFGVWVDALDAYVASQELEPLTAVLRSTGRRRRAASSPSSAARAAGGDRGAQAARAGPRRPALERPGLDRGARRAAAPRYGRARAAGARVPVREGAGEADRGARGGHDHRPRPVERDRVRPIGRRRAGRGGDLRAERRQPVLHAPAGPGRRAAVAQLVRRSPGARRRRSRAWSRPRSSSSSSR